MYEKKEGDVEKQPEKTVVDLGAERRSPLFMIPKNNDFDPEFPTMLYKKGKYVTTEEAQKQEQLEYYSKSLYDLCVQEKREDSLACYKDKCRIMRTILHVLYPSTTTL
jgi:hypothetical protein